VRSEALCPSSLVPLFPASSAGGRDNATYSFMECYPAPGINWDPTSGLNKVTIHSSPRSTTHPLWLSHSKGRGLPALLVRLRLGDYQDESLGDRPLVYAMQLASFIY
jgi:hypothetical protein